MPEVRSFWPKVGLGTLLFTALFSSAKSVSRRRKTLVHRSRELFEVLERNNRRLAWRC